MDQRYVYSSETGGDLNLPGVVYVAVVALPLLYAALVLGMYLIQDSLLYFPDTLRVKPASAGLNAAVEIVLTAEDHEKLVAWYTPAMASMPTILFFHGNGGAISGRTARYAFYTAHGYGVLFLSYRGYGGSTGRPSEKGLLIDAEAAYDWLMAQGLKPAELMLVGESMGTGIATILASRRTVAALALEAPYSSIADVAARRYWWLPVRLLINNRMDAAAAMPDVHVPILMQHGDADDVIPLAFGRKLFEVANEPKQFVAIPGGTHVIFDEATFARELAFFDKVLGAQ